MFGNGLSADSFCRHVKIDLVLTWESGHCALSFLIREPGHHDSGENSEKLIIDHEDLVWRRHKEHEIEVNRQSKESWRLFKFE